MTGRQTAKVAGLLFFSGACALVYQVSWFRELRLVFGASTAANAAVLAIFMGGLGLGGAFLGPRADRSVSPLRFYAHLELAIALSCAVSPFLISVIKSLYTALGGSQVLGEAPAAFIRLGFSALVLGLPTFLMGATLPAAAKAVENQNDQGRGRLAALYGTNTIGAVTGTVLSTFFMLEILGVRNTLWFACAVNALVGLVARSLDRSFSSETVASAGSPPCPALLVDTSPLPSRRLILASAFLVGMAFFLMEMVWYRMLSPILGGSTYTFGAILAVALAGIGAGGGLYAIWTILGGKPGLNGFALTCGIEAALIALPFALGDRLALLAGMTRSLASMGMTWQVFAWLIVTAIVVFPPALVAGFQFPLLVGLLGRGEKKIGNDTGLAYAFNTLGAITGSLAGGFGLMPLLSAPGCWKAVVVILCVLSISALSGRLIRGKLNFDVISPVFSVILAFVFIAATGPTAAWRHSGIGAGRADITGLDKNGVKNWINKKRRTLVWEKDGKESSIGIIDDTDLVFMVNGKADGSAHSDASTQVMLGLACAILHPAPKSSLVIGMGTGQSAGWLGVVPGMRKVDVVELEPAVLEMARRSSATNLNVHNNPKVNVILGDGREVLLTSREKYDIIASEPSNPYRAGVAGLYTVEFYQAAKKALAPGGFFSQWVQAYEVDAATVSTIITTLAAVFPSVEIWQTNPSDLLLICRAEKHPPYPVDSLRARVAAEPFRSALLNAWDVTDLEGFFSRFIAGDEFCRMVASNFSRIGLVNTDDRMLVEFAFARTVGRKLSFSLEKLKAESNAAGQFMPPLAGSLSREKMELNYLLMLQSAGRFTNILPKSFSETNINLARAFNLFMENSHRDFLEKRRLEENSPVYPADIRMAAISLSETGNAQALSFADQLNKYFPAEADVVRAVFLFKSSRNTEALSHLVKAFGRMEKDPWVNFRTAARALSLAEEVAAVSRPAAVSVYGALSKPFAAGLLTDPRKMSLYKIGKQLSWYKDNGRITMEKKFLLNAVAAFEPHVPWNEEFLLDRLKVYGEANAAGASKASSDYADFLADSPSVDVLPIKPGQKSPLQP